MVKFCPQLSSATQPLQTSTNLTKEDMPFLWSIRHQQAFDSAIVLVTSAPWLAYDDVTALVILQVDVSDLKPLQNLTKEEMPFLRSTRHQQVFDSTKVLATSVPCLAYYDVTAPVILWVDASDYDLGAALLQPIKPHNGSALEKSSSTTHFVQFHEPNPYRAALCAK